jgi:hypothetical protein
MEIPKSVHQALAEAKTAWDRLVAHAHAHQAKWPKEQREHFALMAETLAKSHNALRRLVEANT